MAKVAPLKQGKSSWKSKALDPFSDRLYSGVVVYSKSWKEDLVSIYEVQLISFLG